MILFFDRNTGTSVPKALELLRPPFQVEYHQKYYQADMADDLWMPEVGEKGWTIIGHDRNLHQNESELAAIQKYKLGCFYLWGANAKKWDKMKLFLKAYEQIAVMSVNTQRPFVYSVKKNGGLKRIKLPGA